MILHVVLSVVLTPPPPRVFWGHHECGLVVGEGLSILLASAIRSAIPSEQPLQVHSYIGVTTNILRMIVMIVEE